MTFLSVVLIIILISFFTMQFAIHILLVKYFQDLRLPRIAKDIRSRFFPATTNSISSQTHNAAACMSLVTCHVQSFLVTCRSVSGVNCFFQVTANSRTTVPKQPPLYKRQRSLRRIPCSYSFTLLPSPPLYTCSSNSPVQLRSHSNAYRYLRCGNGYN
jgi:hypothetical protein